MRRSIALLIFFTCGCLAQTPYERLAATAKLWAYVKYIHPRVTASGVDWDGAFEAAAPKVLAAKTDAEFSAAVGEMLAVLKDPATKVMPPRAELIGDETRVVFSVKAEDGVTVVRLEKGDQSQMMQNRNGLPAQLRGAGAVVFDLRGSRMATYLVPPTLPVGKTCVSPTMASREHSGYMSPGGAGSGGYQSSWKMRGGVPLTVSATSYRAVFLIDRETWIPEVALAMQNCGAAAIVSEDPVEEAQVDMTRPVPVLGPLQAMVRYTEVIYADGATGISANLVLKERGDAALKAAIELARAGNWPPPEPRVKRELPPAWFAEKNYADRAHPSAERRMLAAARVWAVFHYFHPYKHLYGEDWNAVLTEFLPKMARAENAREYHLAVAEMVARVHDTHCFVGSTELSDYYGQAGPEIELRWVENQPVVTRVAGKLSESVRPGEVLVRIDGEPYQKRADELAKYISASTEQSMKNRVMNQLLRGLDGSSVKVTLRTAGGTEHDVQVDRARANFPLFRPYRPGAAFRLVDPKIGYADLELLTNAQVGEMFEKFKDTEAIILDMRGYPQGTAWSIAPRLADQPGKVAAQFRRSLVSAEASGGIDGFNLYFEQRIPVSGGARYSGKTVMLIDERAISQSEHSGLFYKTANGTVFIGSPTTGANGDTTGFQAPGGIGISFSGHDVRWPDGKQLQRVGLIPDIAVAPTIEGIRAGRDEILERAIVYLQQGK